MSTELAGKYDPTAVEAKWYAHWKQSGFFRSTPDEREPYTVVIPPPNVTGVLHMGHMLNNTIQDTLVRRKRLEGYNCCWVPGTDHASIATETKVINRLAERGIKKQDLTREEFLKHAWEWTDEYGGIILKQLERLGASCDWERTRFTMEDKLSESVIKVFVDLYNKGKIYRGHRMVNWDPVGLTAISDEEVEYEEKPAKLYHVKYPYAEGEGHIVIATTRPETIMADTAVAVNPNDERYKDLIGKKVLVPLVNRPVPVIADDYVDLEFGTGCLKVTPAHSEADFEIGERHGLEIIDIFTETAHLNEKAQVHVGKDRFEARKLVAKDLEAARLLIETEDIKNKVGHSQRSRAVIEPRISEQWFLKMDELTQPALKAVLEDEVIRFVPDKFKNTYRHWLENIRDWTISRQLWWGHQIPAYYFTVDGKDKTVVAEDRDEAYKLAVAEGFEGKAEDLCQDEDVLDTWFSSWLWPISVFDGFTDPGNPDIKYYYPTNDLVTGPDIIFFWVARMIFAGYEYMDERPFNTVFFTSIIRDSQRRKMSKSLGNSPDVLKLIDEYGADAIRLGMLMCTTAGQDLLYDESLCVQGRNFANKIWNAYRLIDSLGENAEGDEQHPQERIATEWLQVRIREAAVELDAQFADYRLLDIARTLYRLIWDDFCSFYLELIKPAQGGALSKPALEKTIGFFEELMQLLHPLMPFVTEELWHNLRQREKQDCITVSRLKDYSSQPANDSLLKDVAEVREIITAIRSFRSEKGVSPKEAFDLQVKTKQSQLFKDLAPAIQHLANVTELKVVDALPDGTQSQIVGPHELFYPDELFKGDEAEERAKLEEELKYNRGFLKSVDKKLSNERFVNNAPEAVVEKEKQKKADAEEKIRVLEQRLASLS